MYHSVYVKIMNYQPRVYTARGFFLHILPPLPRTGGHVFTGLVEEVGTVRSIDRKGAYQRLTIDAAKVLEDLEFGDSISVNGVCQTVTTVDEKGFSVDTLEVSLQKTGLGFLQTGAGVNLERALTPNSRMGGHMVQGHVDGLARITALRQRAENVYLELILPKDLMRYCAKEGSITVEGISLTIADIRGVRIVLNIIPTTWKETTLREHKVGDKLNIEVDMMARYVERILEAQNREG